MNGPFARTNLTFGSPVALWVITLMVGIAAAGMLYLYYRDMKSKRRKRGEFFLWMFRLLVIAWVIAVLLEPTVVKTREFTEESDVIVVIDISDSMDLSDMLEDPLLRWEIARLTGKLTDEQLKEFEQGKLPGEVLTEEQVNEIYNTPRREVLEAFLSFNGGDFFKRLKEKFGLRIYTFASDLKEAEVETVRKDPATLFSLIERETGHTDMGAALGEIEKVVSRSNVSGIVLITDGVWNKGADSRLPATKIRGANVPIYTVGLGNEDEARDIEVVSVKAKKAVQVNDTVSVIAVIKSSGYDNKSATVLLKEGGRTIQEKKIELNRELRTQTVRMEFTPREERMMFCTVQVRARSDEAKKDNNYRTFEVDVTKGKKKVLLIEQLPRWEWRFIKNAVGRDPDFELTMILFNARFMDMPSEGEQYLPMLPFTKRELFGYDIIILGDVAREELSEGQIKLLEKFVADQGSPLVIISGPFHMPQEYRGTAIEKLLPVVMASGVDYEGGLEFEEGYSLELTADGWVSPILQLADSRMENTRVWSDLPKLFWCASIEKAKTTAEVLATHSYLSNRHGKLPLVVTHRYGAGKVLMLNIDSTWRWRYEKGDLYHYRFWGNVLRWLVASPLDGKTKHVLLSVDKKEYTPGETANISVRALDRNFYPYSKDKIVLRILRAPSTIEKMQLQLEDRKRGIYNGEYVFSQSGTFEFMTILPELGAEGNARVRVAVKKVSEEDNSLQMNKKKLEEISKITGGSFHSIMTAGAIPDEIINRRRSREDINRIGLWDTAYAIALVVLFLTAEWLIRKRLGYV